MLRTRSKKKIKNRKYKIKKSFKKKTGQFGGWNENNLSKLYKDKSRKYKKVDKWNKKNIISQYTGFQSGGGWGDNINNIKFNHFTGGSVENTKLYNQAWGKDTFSKHLWDKNFDINNSQIGGWGESPQTVNLGLISSRNLYNNQFGGWQVDLLSINNWDKK